MQHVTVLETEAVDSLSLNKDSVVVDCTLGSGGHAKLILESLEKKGYYIGIDVDPTAIKANEGLKSSYKAEVTLVESNFRDIDTTLQTLGIDNVDAILADLGWRIEQFDGSSGLPRGFSFRSEEPLHMTFGEPTKQSFTAYDIVNDWAAEDIANVIFGYGEEKFSRRIAAAIVEERKKSPIEHANELSEVVFQAVPNFYRHGKTHPATKTFQALRIAVNDEFSALEELIQKGFQLLKPGGRMSIISFHSLEDRIVKHTFRSLVHDHEAILVNKKPIIPSQEEHQDNPRSRSAKLRTIEKANL